MNHRVYSLDALRGYAIITMILSGTIASGVWPGWMYHAQLPPSDHTFDPAVYGGRSLHMTQMVLANVSR